MLRLHTKTIKSLIEDDDIRYATKACRCSIYESFMLFYVCFSTTFRFKDFWMGSTEVELWVDWGKRLQAFRSAMAIFDATPRKVADVRVSRLCFSHYVVLFPCNSIGSPAFREMSPVHLEVMTWKAILQRLLRRFSGQGEHFSLCRGAATWCWCFEGILWSNSLLLYDHTVKFLMFLNTLLEASRIRLEKALKTFRMTEPGWSTSRIHCKPYALGCVK